MKLLEFNKFNNVVSHRVSFTVPLDHFSVTSSTIEVVATIIQHYDPELHAEGKFGEFFLPQKPKLILYLEGGPGFASGIATVGTGSSKEFLSRGYQIVSLDQRGVGYSTPLESSTLSAFDTAEEQLDYLLKFRSDSIVEDCELIRTQLLGKSTKWSLCGQSYGGFVSFTYISKYPQSIKESLLTGGIPPVGLSADQVYTATYNRTRERNVHYYDKYPEDVNKVKRILDYLSNNKVVLPSQGCLSVERFQQLGLLFGGMGGTDSVHKIVHKFDYDLKTSGRPTYLVLTSIEAVQTFDTNMIYAFFLEAIYSDGKSSKTNWVADRLRYTPENTLFVYKPDASVVYFTGEMIFSSIFDDYIELRPFRELAELLHSNETWSKIYNKANLKTVSWEQVPMVAAVYYHDQYVDFQTSVDVKERIFGDRNLKLYVTSECFHNGMRTHSERVLGALFSLLESEFD